MARRPASPKRPGKAKPRAGSKKPAKAASKPAPKSGQWVYTFGGGKAQGRSEMKNLLGGKGANLAEMANLGLPVPPGFTITTAVCTHYYANTKKYPKDLEQQIDAGLAHIARIPCSACPTPTRVPCSWCTPHPTRTTMPVNQPPLNR